MDGVVEILNDPTDFLELWQVEVEARVPPPLSASFSRPSKTELVEKHHSRFACR